MKAPMTVADSVSPEPFGLRLYRMLSEISGPAARFALRRRMDLGKEDPARVSERMGVAGRPRPQGELMWIHGASVGESLSVLPLVRRLQEVRPSLRFLVTTGTVTSAKLLADRLPSNAVHQFIPIDHPRFVRSFLDHWRPDAGVFVESEFWPNLILEARRRVRFLALVNGRVSPKSFEEWKQRPKTIRCLLERFSLLIAQDRQNAERLSQLSGRAVRSFGNLKNAAPALPHDEAGLSRLREETAGRPVWLAASSHPGEEKIVFSAHALLKREFPRILTILAPRHPERGAELKASSIAEGLATQRRSEVGVIDPSTELYVADTLGELGLFYRLTNVAFVGGSLTEKGGHNPLEPARLAVAILHGPHTFNFVETYQEMRSGGGAALVRNDRELATAVRRLLADEKTRVAMADAARLSAEASAERVLNDVVRALLAELEAEARAA